MTRTIWLTIIGILQVLSLQAWSQQAASANASIAPQYYTLRDPSQAPGSFENPVDLLQAKAHSMATKAVSLLHWVLHDEALPMPGEAYRRVAQFGRWINDPTDDTCMNTRAKVLVRDSDQDVTFKNPRNCVVQSGEWQDPYSGATLTQSRQVQIDHLVPLKHAYIAGAWRWDYKTRCLYANFMGAKYHLQSVSGHENMSKGDDSPDAYMPPENSFRCEYLKDWLKVKATWNLAITPDEASAIHQLVLDNHCNLAQFVMSYKELRDVRTYIQNNLNFCALNHR